MKSWAYFLIFFFIFFVVFFALCISDFYHWIKTKIILLLNPPPPPLPEETLFVYTEKENGIEIPSLEVEAPLVFIQDTNQESLKKGLEKGVVYYPGSAMPGEKGQIFILGHSAPAGWPKIKYEWVFSRIAELEPGEIIFLNYDHKQYHYEVKRKIFLEKGEEIPPPEEGRSVLYLITCWPPGRDIRRLAIEAVLIKPSFKDKT